MGCFNGTCVITNLSIHAGDPVKFIPIILKKQPKDHYLRGLCYATDVANPITPAIDGVYDDYGSIDDFDEQSLPAQLLHSRLGMKLSKFLEDFDDGIQIKSYSDMASVGHIMAHKKAYDFLTKRFSREEHKKQAQTEIEMKLGLTELNSKHKKFSLLDELKALPIRFGGIELDCYGESYDLFLEKKKVRKNKIKELASSLANLHMETMAFVSGMNALRKSIYLPCGAGSQADNIKEHLELQNVVSSIALDRLTDKDMNDGGMNYAYGVMLGDTDY